MLQAAAGMMVCGQHIELPAHGSLIGSTAGMPRELPQPGEIARRRKDGTIFPAEASFSEMREDSGRLFTVILLDISRRKAAEEAQRNTTRHARPKTITLCLKQEGDQMVLEVIDDGIGFDPAASFPGHLGLESTRERASAVTKPLPGRDPF